jgi:hypothetical protein
MIALKPIFMIFFASKREREKSFEKTLETCEDNLTQTGVYQTKHLAL